MVRLETGDTGVAVTADSDGALYSGMFGVDNYVVATGNKFKAEIQSNNKIKISDGSAIMNGRHIRVPAGDSELVTINNGSQGMNRIDLIVLRYKKELTGVESGSLVVIQGEETASEPKVPDHVKGDILTGATQADFPLYEVKLEGINITDITPLFQTIGNITELEKKFAELNGNMPIIVPFTVPAFQASTPSQIIKVDLGVTMQDTDYKLSIQNQSVKVSYSSYKWLDCTIDEKTVSSVTIGFYNEQSRAIAKTDWALIIFPS